MQAPTDKPVQITCRYPLNSRTGSVSAELAADGTLLRYEEYYPFGDTSLAATSGTKGLSRFQFAGKERDSGTGLYYFGQRYYIPDRGRNDYQGERNAAAGRDPSVRECGVEGKREQVRSMSRWAPNHYKKN